MQGANFVALCPFHREKTPSFNVNPQRQIFHCFGCHKGGDVFSFVQEYEHLSFAEAVKRLAERAGIQIDVGPDVAEPTRHIKDTLLNLHEQIAQRWQSALHNEACGQVARDYLIKRGVTPDAVQIFRLGYAPPDWADTVNWARSKNIDLTLAEEAGIIVRKENGKDYYDRFRGRLMFPICDEQGRIVAFSGRLLSPDAKAAKYVNSPETPIFSKRRIFYGLDKTKRAILDAQNAIICEGQLDLIACYMAGIRNVVAPQGTAFTLDHARILKRYVNEVVLCFDSDIAGQSAAIRVLDDLLASGLTVRVATVPSPHDPDSYIKEQGGKAFSQIIDRALDFFEFYLEYLCASNDISTDRGRLTVVQAMGQAVKKTGNAVLIDTYAQKTALRLDVSVQAVRTEFNKTVLPKKRQETDEAPPSPNPVMHDLPSTKEYWLIKYLFHDDCHWEWVDGYLDVTWIQHPHVRQIVLTWLETHKNGCWISIPAFISSFLDPQTKQILSNILADQHPIPNLQQQLQDSIIWLRNQNIDRRITSLNHKLKTVDKDNSDPEKLLMELQHLRNQKKAPLAPLPKNDSGDLDLEY